MPIWTRTGNSKTPLRLLWAAEGVSSLANQFMQLLLPWYILTQTGSLLWTGFVAFCSLLPNIFSSLFGGQIIDRLGRSQTMLLCELTQFILLAAIPALIAWDAAYPWLVGLLIFLSSFFDAPGQLARTALAPTFSRYAEVPLSRTTGVVEAWDGVMAVVGPLLGGCLIACAGLETAWLALAAMCLCIVLLSIKIYSGRNKRPQPQLTNWQQALALLKTDAILRQSILLTMPFFILGQSWELLLLPGFIYQQGYGAAFLGLLGAAFGLGAFIGAIEFARAARKFKFFTLLTANYAAYLLSILILYFNLPKAALLCATVLCGLPFGAFSAMISTLILLRAPEQIRGKILGVFGAGSYTVESVCVLAIAALMHGWGLQTTLAVLAGLFGLLVLFCLLRRKQADFWAATSGKTPLPAPAKPKKKQQILLEYKPQNQLRRTAHLP